MVLQEFREAHPGATEWSMEGSLQAPRGRLAGDLYTGRQYYGNPGHWSPKRDL